jgi:hypothetical protein
MVLIDCYNDREIYVHMFYGLKVERMIERMISRVIVYNQIFHILATILTTNSGRPLNISLQVYGFGLINGEIILG